MFDPFDLGDRASLDWRRQPQRRVTRLGNLRHFGDEFVPVDVEELEQCLGARRVRRRKAHCQRRDGETFPASASESHSDFA